VKTTIKDIAKETGLSVTTISLVLNNKPNRISQKTKELIIQTAEKMSYRPNQMAIGLVKKETKIIGLIIPDISNYFFSEIALGVDEEAHKNHRSIIISNTNDHCERDLYNIELLYARGVDAIILSMASDIDDKKKSKYNELLSRINIPIILVDRYDPLLNYSSITLNNRKAAYSATKYLLELGHRKIACITGPSKLLSSNERLEGYAWAYQEYNIPVDKNYIFESNYFHTGGFEAAAEIIKTDATAVFAFNDMMALGAIQYFHKNGYDIPGDYSVVGFDDIYFSEILEVPLTTVRQPAYLMGCEAVKRALFEIQNHNSPKQNISFDADLIPRKSTSHPYGSSVEVRVD